MATVSLREFGRMRGVSGEAVRKAIATGRLVRSVVYDANGRPSIDPVLADQEWESGTNPARGGKRVAGQVTVPEDAYTPPVARHEPPPKPKVEAVPSKPKKEPPADRTPEPQDSAMPQEEMPRGMPGGAAATFAQSRAIKEAYLARLAKLEFEEKSGVMVKADSVKNEAFKVARLVRDAMLNIPDRVSAELAADTDAFTIHRKLTLEIRKALEGLGADNA